MPIRDLGGLPLMQPLARINEAARIAATGNLEHRIHLTGRNDEFRELADTFDFMLGRLHDAFTAQERFAANASHELRTPLTITETLLDVARRNPEEQDYPALIDRLRQTNARAIGLTEALLRQLVSNVVQNAIRHNHESGTVRVTTRHDQPRSVVSLRIENTGDPYTPERAAQLSEPFLRGRGRISRGDRAKQGYGLGLALVARITEVHHGGLTIVPRDGGGLVVTVTLPDASRH